METKYSPDLSLIRTNIANVGQLDILYTWPDLDQPNYIQLQETLRCNVTDDALFYESMVKLEFLYQKNESDPNTVKGLKLAAECYEVYTKYYKGTGEGILLLIRLFEFIFLRGQVVSIRALIDKATHHEIELKTSKNIAFKNVFESFHYILLHAPIYQNCLVEILKECLNAPFDPSIIYNPEVVATFHDRICIDIYDILDDIQITRGGSLVIVPMFFTAPGRELYWMIGLIHEYTHFLVRYLGKKTKTPPKFHETGAFGSEAGEWMEEQAIGANFKITTISTDPLIRGYLGDLNKWNGLKVSFAKTYPDFNARLEELKSKSSSSSEGSSNEEVTKKWRIQRKHCMIQATQMLIFFYVRLNILLLCTFLISF
eukprot:TRINITY_DN34863_c0_g1_i1.p1 TRINITY_DN34863_c0_g1~~TRINITY_DN34863_c0_g1_i1.p1  ORF type:complete len:415 (-),score=4.11 TRINITY_DN34863_c0_g1_i1:49-1161(-)